MPEGARGGTRNGSWTSAPLFVPLIRVPSPKSEAMHASPASVLQRDALCIPRRNGPVGERTCMLSRPSVCDAGPVMLAFFFGCTDIDIEAFTMRAPQLRQPMPMQQRKVGNPDIQRFGLTLTRRLGSFVCGLTAQAAPTPKPSDEMDEHSMMYPSQGATRVRHRCGVGRRLRRRTDVLCSN